MNARKGGLGRGFDSLIPMDVLDESLDPTAGVDGRITELRQLKLDDIMPDPDQPRRSFDEQALAELAASIREHGVLQPLVVSPQGERYRIVAGERRWRAAKLAGLEKLPVLVRTLSDQHRLEIALIENIQREDLNLLETATAYLKLHTQFNLSYEEIAARVGRGRSTVTNILRLLQLPDEAKTALVAGEIVEGHARQILALQYDPAAQQQLLGYIVREGWSVRKAEQFVIGHKAAQEGGANVAEKALAKTQEETPLTQALSKRLELKVVHKAMAKGGRVVIEYTTLEELERLERLLG